jgi:hypothetical protein
VVGTEAERRRDLSESKERKASKFDAYYSGSVAGARFISFSFSRKLL